MRKLVFVYGTLLYGERNHRLLRDATCLGTAEATGFRLVVPMHCCYPVAVPDIDGCIIEGELWEVTLPELARLDRFEGCPTLYQRKTIKACVQRGKAKACEIYVQPGPPAGSVAIGPSWRAWRKEFECKR